MKRIIFLLMVFLLITGGLIGQENQAWDYPTKPGSEKWKKLKNHKQKVETCQIPKEFLSQMKTKELITACQDYPLLLDIFAFNFLQDGINKLKENFDGFKELTSRDDAAIILLSKYKKMDPGKFNKDWSLIEKGDYAINIMLFEIFLSQKELLRSLSTNEKKELVVELLIKLKTKIDPSVYGRISQMTIGLCLVRILEQEGALTDIPNNVTKDDLIHFSEKADLKRTKLLPSIIFMADNFIK